MTFQEAVAFVLREEGGYVHHPADPGGETHWGISKRSYPDLDIKNLTRDQAVEIYRRDFWERSGAPALPEGVRLLHFDTSVNMGVGRAAQFLAASGGDALAYAALRLKFYAELSTWSSFGKGWTRRVARVLEATNPKPQPPTLRANLVRAEGEWTNEQATKLAAGVTLAGPVSASVERTMSGLEVLVLTRR